MTPIHTIADCQELFFGSLGPQKNSTLDMMTGKDFELLEEFSKFVVLQTEQRYLTTMEPYLNG